MSTSITHSETTSRQPIEAPLNMRRMKRQDPSEELDYGPTAQTGGRVTRFYPPPTGPTDMPWTITVYNAAFEQERWQRYNQAANRSYAARGLQAVGEEQVIDIDRYATYFAEASLDGAGSDGEPIGGVRIHAPDPYGGIPLLEELEGYTDTEFLRTLVEKMQPQGVGHGGGLWIDADYGRSGLSGDLARASIPIIVATQARWCVAMTHQRILDAWASLNWHPISAIPFFPYPDDRYQSCVLLGDRRTWPDDLAAWASTQFGGATLDGPGARFMVRPMRAGRG